jgi:hypothetical protein
VAVLRLHAAVSWLRNDCTILAELGERITQLQYLLQLSLRTSENSVKRVVSLIRVGKICGVCCQREWEVEWSG